MTTTQHADLLLAQKIDAARELLDAVVLAPDELTRSQALHMLASTAQSALTQAVPLARAEGATWDEVGRSLGCSRQSAHERFASLSITSTTS